MQKIKTVRQIKRIAARLRKKKRTIVFTNGCFDMLHLGHIAYLERCRRLGDVLIVGVNTDRSVKKIKGPSRPIMRAYERVRILSALACIDYVVLFGDRTPRRLIAAIEPDVLAKGGDWKKSDIVGADSVRTCGGRVSVIPFVKGHSTTRLIERIRKGARSK
jgi:rfaE bifunctional protein nucleotidyltransferase chain/domain